MCFVKLDEYECGCQFYGVFNQCKTFTKTVIRCDEIVEKPKFHNSRCLFHVVPEYFEKEHEMDRQDATNAREDYIDNRMFHRLDVVHVPTIMRWYNQFVAPVLALTSQ